MAKLIHDVKLDFRAFWDLPILKGGQEYPKTGFDALNATLLLERLAETDTHDDLALVLPEDPTALSIILIEALLALLQVDKLESDSSFLDKLNPGDHVGLFDKLSRVAKPGIFLNMHERDGEKWYRIATKQGKEEVIDLIPPSRRWRVKPYVGDKTGRAQQSTKMLGSLIEELLAIDPGELMTNQKTRALLVTGDKASVKDELSSITLGKDPLIDVFPVADYSDTTNYKILGHDRLGRRPSLGLVSHVDLATDIALSDPSVRLIIIDGAAKVRGGISSIDLLNTDGTPRKIVCLLNSWNDEELGMLRERGIDSWVWSQKDFKKLDLSTLGNSQRDSSFQRHAFVLKRLALSDTRLSPVQLPSNADSLPVIIREQLRQLVTSMPDSEKAGTLLIRSHTLFRRMMQAPLPFNQLDQLFAAQRDGLNRPFIDQIDELKRELHEQVGITIPSNLGTLCAQLSGNLKSLYRALEYINPKFEHIVHSLKDGKSTDIVCATPAFASALEHFIAREGVTILSSNELLGGRSEKLLLTGWFNSKFAARTFLAPYPLTEYVLYDEELRPYAWVNRVHLAAPNSQVDQKLRKLYAPQLVKPAVGGVVTPQHQREADIETVSLELENKFGEHLDKDLITAKGPREPIEAVRIVFEDGSRVYAAVNTKLAKLDRSSKNITECTYDELASGDELVFAASSRSIFQDFLASHISLSDEYKDLSTVATIWRDALIEYTERLELTPSDLAIRLKHLGVARGPGNIKAWLEGDIIGPTEDAMDAIKRLTLDSALTHKFGEVLSACRKIRAIHIQAGRSLARHIISAVAGKVEIDDPKYDDNAADFARHAHIMLIRSIGDNKVSIQPELTGRLITS